MKKIFNESSDDDDQPPPSFSSGGAPFLLQVPPTYANKTELGINKRNAITGSAMSNASNSNSNNNADPMLNGGRRSQKSVVASHSSSRAASSIALSASPWESPVPTCYTPRQTLAPVVHKFTVKPTKESQAFFERNRMAPPPPDPNHGKLVPAVVLPSHYAQDHDLSSLTARSASQQPPPHPLLPVAGKKELLARTARPAKAPPPFSSVKTNDIQRTFLEDRDAEQLLLGGGTSSRSSSKQQRSISSSVLSNQQQQHRHVYSSSAALSRLSEGLSSVELRQSEGGFSSRNNSVSCGSSSSRQQRQAAAGGRHVSSSGKKKNNKKHHHHVPPAEDDYIEGGVDDDHGECLPLHVRKELGTFEQITLPPVVIHAASMRKISEQQAAYAHLDDSGGVTPPVTPQKDHVSALGSELIDMGSAVFGSFNRSQGHFDEDAPPSARGAGGTHVIGPTSSDEAATARVARTLFQAGLCTNLKIYDKLRQLPPDVLERKMQSDFLHRRQISKEDFVGFLVRVLKTEHIDRREVDLLFSLMDANKNGIVEARELRTELVRFVTTGIRDISFAFVAALLEGRETHAVNAFISRFDIQNIVRSITNFYASDAEVIAAVSGLPDSFAFKHHLARIPVAVFRDKVLGDPVLLAIFQAVALEARKGKNARGQVVDASANASAPRTTVALSHFAPPSIPNNNASLSGSSAAVAAMFSSTTANNNPAASITSMMDNTATVAGIMNNASSTTTLPLNTMTAQQQQMALSLPTNEVMGIRGSARTFAGSANEPFLLHGGGGNTSTHPSYGGGGGDRSRRNSGATPSPQLTLQNSVTVNAQQHNSTTNGQQQSPVFFGGENSSSNNNNAGGGMSSITVADIAGAGGGGGGGGRRGSLPQALPKRVANNNGQKQQQGSGSSLKGGGGGGANDGSNKRLKRKSSVVLNSPVGDANSSSNAGRNNTDNTSDTQSVCISGRNSSAAGGLGLRLHQPIVVADRYMAEDEQRQVEAEEHYSPTWFTKANVLYHVSNKDKQPRPVFQN